MVEIFSEDFTQGFVNWTSVSGTPTIVASPANTGQNAVRIDAHNTFLTKILGAYTDLVIEGDVYLTALPWAEGYSADIFRIGDDANWAPLICRVMYRGTVHWNLRDDEFAGEVDTASIVQTNTKYHIRLVYSKNGACALWVDGVQVATLGGKGRDATRVDVGGSNALSAVEFVESVVVDSSGAPPPPVGLAVSISPTSAIVQEGGSQDFVATVTGGTTPYTVSWVDNATQNVIGTGTQFMFNAIAEGTFQIFARVTDYANATVTSNIATINVYGATQPVTPADGPYKVNCVWVDAGYNTDGQPEILVNNLPKFLNDCASNHITHVMIQVGWWDSTDPAHPTVCYMAGYPGMRHSKAFYDDVVAQLHVLGIKAIAWLGNIYNAGLFGPQKTQPASGPKLMEMTLANRQNYINAVVALMSGDLANWDGYNDDVETFVSDNGTWRDQADFYSALTPALHAIGKLNMPATPLDWQMNYNPYCFVDYIVTMFYGGGGDSTFNSPSAGIYWQEEFGIYTGNQGLPASPIILGLDVSSRVSWQLGEVQKYLDMYPVTKPLMAGVCWWMYEHMGTVSAPDDWAQWKYWIDHIGTATPPISKIITLQATPTDVTMDVNGMNRKTPYSLTSFLDLTTVNLTAPPQSQIWANQQPAKVQPWGDSGLTDFGGILTLGADGYNKAFGFDFCNGPYILPAPLTVSQIFFYSFKNARVKIAIYNSRNISDADLTQTPPSGFGIPQFPGGFYPHPNQKIAETIEFLCVANTWNAIPLANGTITLPASTGGSCSLSQYGDRTSCQSNGGVWHDNGYFLVIKAEEDMMMSRGISVANTWGRGQAINGYGGITGAFPNTYQNTDVWGGFGSDIACYIGLNGPPTQTTYNFNVWSDGVYSPQRTFTTGASAVLTAIYVAGAVTPVLTTQVSPINAGTITATPSPPYSQGTVVTLKATSVDIYHFQFVKWTDGFGTDYTGTNEEAPTSDTTTVAMDASRTIVAVFQELGHPTLTLVAVPPTGGTLTVAETPPYTVGQVVHVTAVPSTNHKLTGWLQDGTPINGTDNPIAITLDTSHVLTATFELTPIQAGFPLWVLIPVGAVGAWYLLSGDKHKRKK